MLSISNNFDNSSLLVAIKELPKKTIFLIEDIDSLFEKRNFSTDNNSLTFSNFINILDGILYRHSTIIFLTTNHPEKLDHALLRIGRIDMIIKFDYPSRNNIEKLFNDQLKNIYNEKELKDNFNSFYELIKDKKIAMSAIINFLFRYKNTWNIYIKELLDTNNFIRETLKQNKTENMYN
jgi:chaperone BCS1